MCMQGGDLDHMIKQLREAGKCLEENLIMDWFVQLTNAIRYIHDRLVKDATETKKRDWANREQDLRKDEMERATRRLLLIDLGFLMQEDFAP